MCYVRYIAMIQMPNQHYSTIKEKTDGMLRAVVGMEGTARLCHCLSSRLNHVISYLNISYWLVHKCLPITSGRPTGKRGGPLVQHTILSKVHPSPGSVHHEVYLCQLVYLWVVIKTSCTKLQAD